MVDSGKEANSRKCTVPECSNEAKYYDPIDGDLICQEHFDHFKKCGIKTEYRKLTYPGVSYG